MINNKLDWIKHPLTGYHLKLGENELKPIQKTAVNSKYKKTGWRRQTVSKKLWEATYIPNYRIFSDILRILSLNHDCNSQEIFFVYRLTCRTFTEVLLFLCLVLNVCLRYCFPYLPYKYLTFTLLKVVHLKKILLSQQV